MFHPFTPLGIETPTSFFNKPYFVICNRAIGGRFPGDLTPEQKWATMYVDSIRYYTINGQGKVTGTAAAIKAGKPTK